MNVIAIDKKLVLNCVLVPCTCKKEEADKHGSYDADEVEGVWRAQSLVSMELKEYKCECTNRTTSEIQSIRFGVDDKRDTRMHATQHGRRNPFTSLPAGRGCLNATRPILGEMTETERKMRQYRINSLLEIPRII